MNRTLVLTLAYPLLVVRLHSGRHRRGTRLRARSIYDDAEHDERWYRRLTAGDRFDLRPRTVIGRY